MGSFRALSRIDGRIACLAFLIQLLGCCTIAAFSEHYLVDGDGSSFPFFLPQVRSQLAYIGISWVVFFCTVFFDYSKLRNWIWILYGISIIALIGLFFTDPIVRVQRWYRIPFIGMSLQPSELVKLVLVLTLSWYFEWRSALSSSFTTCLGALLIAGIPFILILKQPDLGTALVLYPITLVILYVGGIGKRVLLFLCIPGAFALAGTALIFSGMVPYETIKPYALKVMKEYQFERLNPDTHHQRASQIAIALGGVTGSGWRQGEYWRGGALPAPYTDSIMAAFGEEFGLIGLFVLLILYYMLIALSFKTALVAQDPFGRLVTSGLSVYLAVHIIINIGMMVGCFPITGVPLVLMSYGGSSMVSTMMALGLIQSVYARRFMF